MPLSDIQIKRAKPAEKPFTLNDGNGLSLLVETSGTMQDVGSILNLQGFTVKFIDGGDKRSLKTSFKR